LAKSQISVESLLRDRSYWIWHSCRGPQWPKNITRSSATAEGPHDMLC